MAHAGRFPRDIYSRAVAEYVARHAPDRVIEALDRTVGEVGEAADPFVSASAGRVLMRSEW